MLPEFPCFQDISEDSEAEPRHRASSGLASRAPRGSLPEPQSTLNHRAAPRHHKQQPDPRYRRIIKEERRALDAHIAEIQAEQEQRNAALHKIAHSHIGPPRIAERYAAGRPRALRRGQLEWDCLPT